MGGFDRRLIAPMLIGSMLNPVNSSIIAVSLVPIGMAFGAPPAQTAWLVSSLYLATSIGQPMVGRLVDTPGLHHLAWFLIVVAGLFGALTVFDRSLARIGRTPGDPVSIPRP